VNTHQKEKGTKGKAEDKRASQVSVLQNGCISRAKWVQDSQRLQEGNKVRLHYRA
jgi:FKBP-type peptidyl-prolyl cis-trans isomerase